MQLNVVREKFAVEYFRETRCFVSLFITQDRQDEFCVLFCCSYRAAPNGRSEFDPLWWSVMKPLASADDALQK